MTIKGINIGEGEPIICVAVCEADEASVIAKVRELCDAGVLAIEWRVDFYEHYSRPDLVVMLLNEIKAMIGDICFIFTCRTVPEGGKGDPTKEFYMALLMEAAKTRIPDFIDVEADRLDDTKDFISKIKETGRSVISSHHDFYKTPGTADIISRIYDMYDDGADIAKIAVMPKSFSDTARVMDATMIVKEARPDRPLIMIAMGRLGAITRLVGEACGSCLTFATIGEGSAPGQMKYENVKKAIAAIHTCLEEE